MSMIQSEILQQMLHDKLADCPDKLLAATFTYNKTVASCNLQEEFDTVNYCVAVL